MSDQPNVEKVRRAIDDIHDELGGVDDFEIHCWTYNNGDSYLRIDCPESIPGITESPVGKYAVRIGTIGETEFGSIEPLQH